MGGLVSATRGGELSLPWLDQSKVVEFAPRRRGVGRLDDCDPGIEALAIPGVRRYPYGKEKPGSFWTQVPDSLWLNSGFDAEVEFPPWNVELTRPLHAYQQKGVGFLAGNDGALLGWSVGLGKTIAAAAAATLCGGQTLICAPLALRDNWRRELEATGLSDGTDFTSLSSRIGSADFRDKAKLKKLGADFSHAKWIFCHYDVLEAWAGWLRWEKIPVVIFDESHRLRGRNSQRARGAGIAALEARHVWCLTGTPMANGPADLYPQLNLMHPGGWGSYTDFCGRYAGRSRTAFGFNNSGTVEEQYVLELQARLAHCLDRKTRQDVGLELPPLSLVDVTMEDQAIQLAHQQVLGNMDAELLLEHILSGGKLGSGVLAILNSMRLETSKAKIGLTAEYCTNLHAQGERVLVFTWYKEVAKALADRLGGFAVDGDMPAGLRDKVSQHFQAGGGSPFLVATYGALGEGVNLQGVHQVVLHDLDWLPLTIIQAIGRSHRQGQRFAVTAHFMLVRGSFDEFMLRILRTKANLIEMIEQVSSELSGILNNIELTSDEISDWIGELGAWKGDW